MLISRSRAIIKKEYPGSQQYMELTDGTCHYQIDGPQDGKVLTMIHGATVPAWEFDRLVPYLNNAGYRTIRADLFGHGYSDRPRCRYDIALFTRQWLELMHRLKIQQPVHVLGHSLGAVVAAGMVQHKPAAFCSLILAAPMIDYVQNLPVIRLLEWPGFGELLMYAYVMPMLVRRRTRRYRPIEDGRFVQKFKDQLLKPGFAAALLSLFRSGTLSNQLHHYQEAAQHGIPTLLLRGEHDQVVSSEQVELLSTLFEGSGPNQVEGTAHAFLLTDPDKLAPIIISHMDEVATP